MRQPDPIWAIVLGLVAGAVCAYAIELKYKIGVDDTLDVVGIHLVAGVIGTLYLGFFAIDTGLFTGGNYEQLGSRPSRPSRSWPTRSSSLSSSAR